MPCLLRCRLTKYAVSPPGSGEPHARAMSPAPLGSSLITRAPKSASMVEQKGPARAWLRSMTVTSSSGKRMDPLLADHGSPAAAGGAVVIHMWDEERAMAEFPECMLIVTVEVDASIEAEWNRWYDAVHLPDALRCPGVRRGRRYVSSGEISESASGKTERTARRIYTTIYEL